MEKSLNPRTVKVENSLSLRLIAAMDSSRSVISSTNQRNEERNEARTRVVMVRDSRETSRPTVTPLRPLRLQRGCILHANHAERTALPHALCAQWRKWLTLVIKLECSIILFHMHI